MDSEDQVKEIRRQNVLQQFDEFKARVWTDGRSLRSIESAFAEHLGVSPQTWSMMKQSRQIGARQARKLERRLDPGGTKLPGWLDQATERPLPVQSESEARAAFLAVASFVWDTAAPEQRRELVAHFKCVNNFEKKSVSATN